MTNQQGDVRAAVLIASEKPGDIELVSGMLDGGSIRIFKSQGAETAAQNFSQQEPQVLILAFDSLAKSERYVAELRGHGDAGQWPPYRCIVLCGFEEIRKAYEGCCAGTFDDYVLFWPMPHDNLRLAMSVRLALRHGASEDADQPSAADFAAKARQFAAAESLVASQMEEGRQHFKTANDLVAQAGARIGGAIDNFSDRLRSGEFSDFVEVKDSPRLEQELARLKAEEIHGPLNAVRKSLAPLGNWARNFREQMQPHMRSARSLGEMAQKIRPLVLVVDDDQTQRYLLRSVLAREGCRTILASSGQEALTALARARIDVVLMDFSMPGMDGLETLFRIKRVSALASVPVLMVTARSDGNIVRDSLKAGASDFIVKPIKPAVLSAKINRTLSGASTQTQTNSSPATPDPSAANSKF